MENQQLRDFLRENLYRHSKVALMSTRADEIIDDLYNSYIKHPDMLPATSAEHIQTRGLERTVCDYIAGMTDRFALGEHARFDVKSAQVQNTKVSI